MVTEKKKKMLQIIYNGQENILDFFLPFYAKKLTNPSLGPVCSTIF